MRHPAKLIAEYLGGYEILRCEIQCLDFLVNLSIDRRVLRACELS